uniref:hypothetical protein n=1 Tax=Agrobacterium fabrum TaxID=1176649 RepID=UPI00155DAC28|nr:hypothetical protein [Agrobacterium fabrum]
MSPTSSDEIGKSCSWYAAMRQIKTVVDRLERLSAAARASQTNFLSNCSQKMGRPQGTASHQNRRDHQVCSRTAEVQVSGPTQISALNVGSRRRGSPRRANRSLTPRRLQPDRVTVVSQAMFCNDVLERFDHRDRSMALIRKPVDNLGDKIIQTLEQ